MRYRASPAAEKQKGVLLGYLDAGAGAGAGAKGEMDVDTGAPSALVVSETAAKASPSPAPGTPASPPSSEFLPELDIYLTLLVIVHLLDQKKLDKVRVPTHALCFM